MVSVPPSASRSRDAAAELALDVGVEVRGSGRSRRCAVRRGAGRAGRGRRRRGAGRGGEVGDVGRADAAGLDRLGELLLELSLALAELGLVAGKGDGALVADQLALALQAIERPATRARSRGRGGPPRGVRGGSPTGAGGPRAAGPGRAGPCPRGRRPTRRARGPCAADRREARPERPRPPARREIDSTSAAAGPRARRAGARSTVPGRETPGRRAGDRSARSSGAARAGRSRPDRCGEAVGDDGWSTRPPPSVAGGLSMRRTNG